MSEVQDKAIRYIIEYERTKGRVAIDTTKKVPSPGYDLLSIGSGERRCIEVKSRSAERQTFVTMDGGLLKRLGPDVTNYYLYLIKRVNTSSPVLRVIPPDRVLSNLQTEVRFSFRITRKSMEGIREIILPRIE